MSKFEGFEETTFHHLKMINLTKDCSQFEKTDSLSELFQKYFDLTAVNAQDSKSRFLPLILCQEAIFPFGSAINAITHLHGKMFIS